MQQVWTGQVIYTVRFSYGTQIENLEKLETAKNVSIYLINITLKFKGLREDGLE